MLAKRPRSECRGVAEAAAAANVLFTLGRARVWRYDAVAAMWDKYDAITTALLVALAATLLLQWALSPPPPPPPPSG